MKKIFFATPIAGYGSEKQMLEYKDSIINFINLLKKDYDVFAEIAVVRSIYDYDSPAKSAEMDFQAIDESDIFVIHYPQKVPTSALIELGYAFGKSKKIVIITPDKEILPYLAQELDLINSKAKIIISKDINSENMNVIHKQINAITN